MDKTSITLGIGAIAIIAAAVVYEETKAPTLPAGPANGDKCVAQLVGFAKDGRVSCAVQSVHVSKAGPANGFKDDAEMSPVWICSGGVPADQGCLTEIAGSADVGARLEFMSTDKGATWNYQGARKAKSGEEVGKVGTIGAEEVKFP